MHKARENNNGSFSIGKTWVLDDLTAIQSYNHLVPTNAEEQQAKERAKDIGFIVTIQKPYYWQASTAKEKDFFIYSLIKIYKKYTAGKLPQLVGFDPRELEQFGGASPMPPNGTSPRPPYTPAAPHTPGIANVNGRPSPGPSIGGFERPLMTPQLEQNVDPARGPRQRPSQERSLPTDSESFSRPSQERSQRTESESRSRPSQEGSSRAESESRTRPSQERMLRTTDSDDRIPYVPGQFPSSDFVRNLKPQVSQPQIPPRRSDSPSSRNGGINQPDVNLRRLAGEQSTESFRNGPGGQSNRYQTSRQPSEEGPRQNGILNPSNRSESTDSIRGAVSDRPHLTNGVPRDPSQFRNGVLSHPTEASGSTLAPTLPPDVQGRGTREPSRESNRSNLEKPDIQDEKEPQPEVPPGEHIGQAPISKTPISDLPSSQSTSNKDIPSDPVPLTSPPVPPEPSTDGEVHRPGLGPMIKSKKSNKEIAATFRNAAKSYNAFKPRPGGAAEKLRDAKDTSGNEPDGITGVVPAPSLLARQRSQAQFRSPTPDQKSPGQPALPTPSIQIPPQPLSPEPAPTFAQPHPDDQSREPPVVGISTPPVKQLGTDDGAEKEVVEKAPDVPHKVQDEPRRKRKSDHSAKYAKALGIDPSLLHGRTFEIETVLNDFGWGEGSAKRNTFEELQSGVKKELARIEAGSWLGSVENNDERIAIVGNMMDRVIAECEEFDCLLTLYNVELGVCGMPRVFHYWLTPSRH